MTPSILDLREMNSITKLRVQRAKLVHAFRYPLPQAARLHDLSIQRDYVVMTDHPACYDLVKEATECRCARAAMRSTKSCAAPPKQSDQIVCLRCGGTLYAREGEFVLKYFRAVRRWASVCHRHFKLRGQAQAQRFDYQLTKTLGQMILGQRLALLGDSARFGKLSPVRL